MTYEYLGTGGLLGTLYLLFIFGAFLPFNAVLSVLAVMTMCAAGWIFVRRWTKFESDDRPDPGAERFIRNVMWLLGAYTVFTVMAAAAGYYFIGDFRLIARFAITLESFFTLITLVHAAQV